MTVALLTHQLVLRYFRSFIYTFLWLLPVIGIAICDFRAIYRKHKYKNHIYVTGFISGSIIELYTQKQIIHRTAKICTQS